MYIMNGITTYIQIQARNQGWVSGQPGNSTPKVSQTYSI